MRFDYRLKRETEELAGIRLEVESLANLNEAIDQLFAFIEKEGNPQLLETLCPYFGVVWPSARALAGWLAEQGPRLRERSVLEVGCGLAIPSLLAAKLGARVTAADFHPDIPGFLERNLAANGLEGRVRYVAMDWQRPEGKEDGKAAETGLGRHDWVIGSDILYERQHPGPVARSLAAHVAEGGTIALADPGRPYLQVFADEMRALGFEHEMIPRVARDEPKPKEVFLLVFRR